MSLLRRCVGTANGVLERVLISIYELFFTWDYRCNFGVNTMTSLQLNTSYEFTRPTSALLTPVQQGMLIASLRYPEQGFEFEQIEWTISDSLNLDALTAAWDWVYSRHDTLRLTVSWSGKDTPEQSISTLIPTLQVHHHRGCTPRQRNRIVHQFLAQDRQHAPQPDQPPLSRLNLLRFDDHDHVLVWSFLHLLLDGRSAKRILEEVALAYTALCNGSVPELQPAPSILPYAQWRSDAQTMDPGFWGSYLANFDHPNALPDDPDALPDIERRNIQAEALLSRAETQRLQQVAGACGGTVNTMVQAAWSLILASHSGDDDLVFGTIRACRHGGPAESREVCGVLMNMLPLRVNLNGVDSLSQLIRQLRQRQHQLRDHELAPLHQITDSVAAGNEAPLFESILVYDHCKVWSVAQQQLGDGHQFRLYEQPLRPLSISIVGEPQLHITVMVDCSRFSQAYANRLANQFKHVLLTLAAAPDTALNTLDLLPASEWMHTVEQYNDTAQALPSDTCLQQLVQHSVARYPDRVAVISEQSDYTYADLEARANRIAHRLLALGAGRGEKVAVRIPRSFDQVATLLAVLKTGAAYVPLETGWPEARVSIILDTIAPVALVTDDPCAQGALLPDRTVHLSAEAEQLAALPADAPHCPSQPDDLAYVIFTSGSTGQPKGVMINHRAAVNTVLDCNQRFSVSPQDRVFGISSCAFDLSVYDVFGTFAAGAALVVCPRDATRDPTVWRRMIAQHQITIWNSVPALVEMLIEPTHSDPVVLPSLRLVMMSGDWIPMDLPERLRGSTPNAVQMSLGGATEAAIWSILHPITSVDKRLHSIPYGRPMANQTFYVLDRHLRPCPTLVAGDLFIGGAGLACGYWADTERTDAAFFQHPIFGRLYRTGDRGRHLADGNIEFLGRIDTQVKLHGFRIELGEIESVACELPWVHRCISTVREEVPGQPYLAAWVLTDEDHTDLQPLLSRWRSRLPGYMIPRSVQRIESMPLSANGKVDLSALPAPTLHATAATEAMDWHPDEQRLARLWEQLLGRRPDHPERSFFDFGGNSLQALRLTTLVEREFGRRVSLRSVFEYPTLRRFRQQLDDDSATDSLILPLQTEGDRLPFFLIAEYFDIGRYVAKDQPVYGIPLSASIMQEQPQLDYPALARLCISAMRKIQPKGPYCVGGHCFGAVVSFQVAAELQRQGESVRFLALLDPPVPQGIGAPTQDPWDRLRYHWQRIRKLGPAAAPRYIVHSLGNLIGQLRQTAQGLAPQRILASFIPEPLTVDTTMVLAEHGYYRFKPDQDPRLAWGRWCGHMTVQDTAGDHVTFCREPNVQELANYLCQRLAQTQQQEA